MKGFPRNAPFNLAIKFTRLILLSSFYLFTLSPLVLLLFPVDRWRLGLSNEFSSYLHATIANGYKQQRAFILAQTPLPATIRNLWKVIYDSNVSAIVQLTELREEGKEVCTQYWPKKKGQLREFKDFEVDLISEEEALAGFTVRNLSVLEFKVRQLELH